MSHEYAKKFSSFFVDAKKSWDRLQNVMTRIVVVVTACDAVVESCRSSVVKRRAILYADAATAAVLFLAATRDIDRTARCANRYFQTDTTTARRKDILILCIAATQLTSGYCHTF